MYCLSFRMESKSTPQTQNRIPTGLLQEVDALRKIIKQAEFKLNNISQHVANVERDMRKTKCFEKHLR